MSDELTNELLKAINTNNLKEVKILVNNGADIFHTLNEEVDDDEFLYRLNPFFLAAEKNYNILKYFISISKKLNELDEFTLGEAAIYASGSGNLKNLLLLIKNEAYPHFDGYMPIGRAAIYGKLNIVKFILHKYPDKNATKEALDFASGYNHPSIVKYILNTYKDVNSKDALKWALQERLLNIIDIFLKYKVNLDNDLKIKIITLALT